MSTETVRRRLLPYCIDHHQPFARSAIPLTWMGIYVVKKYS